MAESLLPNERVKGEPFFPFLSIHGNRESDMVSGEAWGSESGQVNPFKKHKGISEEAGFLFHE